MGIKLVKKNEASSKGVEYPIGDAVIVKVNPDGKYMVRCTPEYVGPLEMTKSAYTWGWVVSSSWKDGEYVTSVRNPEIIARELRSSVIGLIGKPMAEGRDAIFGNPVSLAKAAEAVCKGIASPEYDAVAEKIHKDFQEKFPR